MAEREPTGFVRISGNGACSVVIDTEQHPGCCQDALEERHSKLTALLIALVSEEQLDELPKEHLLNLLWLAKDLALEARALSRYMDEMK